MRLFSVTATLTTHFPLCILDPATTFSWRSSTPPLAFRLRQQPCSLMRVDRPQGIHHTIASYERRPPQHLPFTSQQDPEDAKGPTFRCFTATPPRRPTTSLLYLQPRFPEGHFAAPLAATPPRRPLRYLTRSHAFPKATSLLHSQPRLPKGPPLRPNRSHHFAALLAATPSPTPTTPLPHLEPTTSLLYSRSRLHEDHFAASLAATPSPRPTTSLPHSQPRLPEGHFAASLAATPSPRPTTSLSYS